MSTLQPSINWNPLNVDFNPLNLTNLGIGLVVTFVLASIAVLAVIIWICCCIPLPEIPIPEQEPLLPPDESVERMKSAIESRKSHKIFTSNGVLEVAFSFYGDNELRWELYNVKIPSKKYKLNFKDIIEVRNGKGTDNFNFPTKVKIPENRCFSIITKNFTLDIVAESEQERDLLVKGFEKLISGSTPLDIGNLGGFGAFDISPPSVSVEAPEVSISIGEPSTTVGVAEPEPVSIGVGEPSASVSVEGTEPSASSAAVGVSEQPASVGVEVSIGVTEGKSPEPKK